ncbi:MAG: hypothetical protein K6E10_09830 [Eubacterium sp.]|nr:hypothetical protein [Eubacterium sp.]
MKKITEEKQRVCNGSSSYWASLDYEAECVKPGCGRAWYGANKNAVRNEAYQHYLAKGGFKGGHRYRFVTSH